MERLTPDSRTAATAEAPVLEVTEKGSRPKAKKPRSEAQMVAFQAAVEKLRAKRDAERETKSQRKAAEAAQKAEAKAIELKAKVQTSPASIASSDPAPIVPPASPAAAPASAQSISAPPHFDFLRDVERLLDAKLARLAPASDAKIARRRAKTVVESESDSDDDEPPPKSKKSLPLAPVPRTVPSSNAVGRGLASSVSAQPAWFETLFPAPRR